MGCYASELIKTARKWTDYQEKKTLGTEEQLSQKHWNPGSNNYTIFWLWFNKHFGWTCQGQAWCMGSAVEHYVNTFGVEKTMELLRISNKKDLSLVNCNQFVTSHSGDERLSDTPKVGGLCFFHNGKKWAHVGIVTGVYKTYVTTHEGNTSGGDNKVDPDGGAIVEKKHSFTLTKMKFWNPDFDDESKDQSAIETHKITVGKDGLKVACALNYRSFPVTGKVLGVFKTGTAVFPTEKAFVHTESGVNVWYHDEHGWFSASKLEKGWVQEENGRWWYIKLGYKSDVNRMVYVGEDQYYADNTGYIVQSDWVDVNGDWYYFDTDGAMAKYAYVKSESEDKYYWVNSSGKWLESETTTTPDLKKYKLVR